MRKNNRKDPAWKYGKEVASSGDDKKTYLYIECRFCKKTITGGVKRVKEHLACTHKNVAPCPNVPENVKKEIEDYMKTGSMQKHLSQQQFDDMVHLGNYYEGDDNNKAQNSTRGIRGPMDRYITNIGDEEETNNQTPKMTPKELRSKISLDVGRFFFENAIPFNAIESPSFVNMCRAIGSYGGFGQILFRKCNTLSGAIRVLSLTCSSSECERNWSTFNQVHTKRRNRLTTTRLNTLVYILYNKKLKARHTRLKTLQENDDPLTVEELPSDDEWIADQDLEIQSNILDLTTDDSNVDLVDVEGVENSSRSSHTKSQPNKKRTYSRRAKGKAPSLLIDEDDDMININSDDENYTRVGDDNDLDDRIDSDDNGDL